MNRECKDSACQYQESDHEDIGIGPPEGLVFVRHNKMWPGWVWIGWSDEVKTLEDILSGGAWIYCPVHAEIVLPNCEFVY